MIIKELYQKNPIKNEIIKLKYINNYWLIKDYNSIVISDSKNMNKNNFLFSDSQFIFSNKFITNPEIEKYYGKYKQINTKEDSIQNRINWVLNKDDLGSLYFNIVLKVVNKKLGLMKDKVNNQKKI